MISVYPRPFADAVTMFGATANTADAANDCCAVKNLRDAKNAAGMASTSASMAGNRTIHM
jgi:hypothetical protein